MSIGEKIRKAREERNMKQETLAAAVSVSVPMICRIEKGAKLPSLSLLISIARALECSAGQLLD